MNRNKKKYEALRDDLETFIKDNNLKQFDKLPTVRELLKSTDYSYATLNRTLLEMERDGIIIKRQGKGLYVNRISGRRTETKQVALLIPKDFSVHKIFLDILAGVRTALEQSKIGLMVSISSMSHEKEKETVAKMLHQRVDGMIIFLEDHYRNDYAHIVELKEKGFPFVLIDRIIPELDTDYVVIDNRSGMLRVCSYLKYNRNCSSIFFVKSNDSSILASSSDDKLIGYRAAMQTLYGDPAGQAVSLDEFVASLGELSTRQEQIGACLNHDTMIPDFLKRLEATGKTLPANVHMFGYNNSYETPFFPTVEQFNDRMGGEASEILLAKMTDPSRPTVQVKIQPRLILPDGKGNYRMEPWVTTAGTAHD